MNTKLLTLITLLISLNLAAQTYRFAWISDTHIGYDNADLELDSVVQAINSLENIDFTIVSGDIAEKGMNRELTAAKEILDQLSAPYYIIPGNHDTKWSESGGTKFIELWADDKFFFEHNNDIFIGLNSGIPWKGGGGHIKPEDLRWLETTVEGIDSTKEIYLVTHHALNEDIDNYFRVSNLLRNKSIRIIFNGHGHLNKIYENSGIPAAMGRSSLSKKNDSWGFSIVENSDSVAKFFEVERDTALNYWGSINKTVSLSIPYIEKEEFVNYDTEIKLQIDLQATVVALPVYYNDLIFTTDYSGIVSCFDSTGSLIWDYDAFGNIVSTPAIIDNYFIVGTAQGDLITLNAITGEQIQSIGFDEGITSQLIAFDYSGTKQLLLPKNSSSKACVVIGTSTGKVYCYDVETLQEYWIFTKAEGMIETRPLHHGNKIIFGCWDSKVYCVDDRNGLLIWQWNEIKNFYYSPAACWPINDGKKVYFTSPNKNVYAIDLELGITNWKKDNYDAWESIGISDDNRLLYVKGYMDKFHVVSAITTNWMQIVKMNYGLDTMPGVIIEHNKNAVFNSVNGHVYSVSRSYKTKPLLFLGNCRVHSVQEINNGMLMASNMDGKIVLFKTD